MSIQDLFIARFAAFKTEISQSDSSEAAVLSTELNTILQGEFSGKLTALQQCAEQLKIQHFEDPRVISAAVFLFKDLTMLSWDETFSEKFDPEYAAAFGDLLEIDLYHRGLLLYQRVRTMNLQANEVGSQAYGAGRPRV